MKKCFAVIAAIVLVLAGTSTLVLAGEKPDLGSPQKYDRAEANLLVGLQSDNLGLKESSAYMLAELKSQKAVVPLMKLLRSDDHESTRIIAALALCRIGDARGVYAVKQAVRFDGSDQVQKYCAWFYDQYVSPGSYDFVASGEQGPAPYAAR